MGNTINVQGSYIDVHDNENVYLSVDKAEVSMGQEPAEEVLNEEVESIVNRLKPIFFGIESDAREFLVSIEGMKATQITAKVNQLVGEGKISPLSSHRDLWRVLHDCGLYEKSESNWNQQVN